MRQKRDQIKLSLEAELSSSSATTSATAMSVQDNSFTFRVEIKGETPALGQPSYC